MKKKVWITISISLVLIAMIGVGVYRQAFAKAPSVETTSVTSEEISSTLMIPGTLSLQEKQEVYLSADKGEFKEILVQEGQQVKVGDVIATLENPTLELQIEQNKLSIESTNLQITSAKKKMDSLNNQLKELTKTIGEAAAKEQLAAEIEAAELEKKMADLDLKQNQVEKQSLDKQTAELTIKSTIDGVVLSVNNQTATTTEASASPIIMIGKLDGMVATGLLSEYDTLKVSVGQKVALTSDAVPDQEWEGEISEIGTLPEDTSLDTQSQSQAVQYPVKVKVTSSMNLKPGFQLIMTITTESKTASVIPVEALIGEGGSSYVYILKNNTAQRKEVETGITSGDKIEILKGVSETDKIIMNPPEGITDGMEVTPL